MNLFEQVLASGNGSAVEQLAGQFGLDPAQVQSAIGQLLPALAGGLQRHAQTGGLDPLLGMAGSAARHFSQDPGALSEPGAAELGQGVLGEVFGGSEIVRSVAERASAATGLGPEVLERMLPMVATLLMGTLAGQSHAADASATAANEDAGIGGLIGGLLGGGAASAGSNALMDTLSSFLDQNQDGSMVDDVVRMLGQRS